MTVNEYGIDLKIILTSKEKKFRPVMHRMINIIIIDFLIFYKEPLKGETSLQYVSGSLIGNSTVYFK